MKHIVHFCYIIRTNTNNYDIIVKDDRRIKGVVSMVRQTIHVLSKE